MDSGTSGPFFGQIHLLGGKAKAKQVVDPAAVQVPAYYPDCSEIRQAIARHYDTIVHLDQQVGTILAALERDHLLQRTVIFFFSDHGSSLPRSKQFLYEDGIRVPCIVAGPGIPQGMAREDLVSGLDLTATTLALAGINVPPHMHGRNLFGQGNPRDQLVAARDRCDYTIDRIRAVVTQRYKYIRNFMTDRPYLQPQYRDGRPELEVLRDLYAKGELNPVQAVFAGPARPAEELYDIEHDPDEIHNLVHDPRYAQVLGDMRNRLSEWIVSTGDQGQFPESDAALRAVVQRWGDKAVNPEYDRVRPARGQ